MNEKLDVLMSALDTIDTDDFTTKDRLFIKIIKMMYGEIVSLNLEISNLTSEIERLDDKIFRMRHPDYD